MNKIRDFIAQIKNYLQSPNDDLKNDILSSNIVLQYELEKIIPKYKTDEISLNSNTDILIYLSENSKTLYDKILFNSDNPKIITILSNVLLSSICDIISNFLNIYGEELYNYLILVWNSNPRLTDIFLNLINILLSKIINNATNDGIDDRFRIKNELNTKDCTNRNIYSEIINFIEVIISSYYKDNINNLSCLSEYFDLHHLLLIGCLDDLSVAKNKQSFEPIVNQNNAIEIESIPNKKSNDNINPETKPTRRARGIVIQNNFTLNNDIKNNNELSGSEINLFLLYIKKMIEITNSYSNREGINSRLLNNYDKSIIGIIVNSTDYLINKIHIINKLILFNASINKSITENAKIKDLIDINLKNLTNKIYHAISININLLENNSYNTKKLNKKSLPPVKENFDEDYQSITTIISKLLDCLSDNFFALILLITSVIYVDNDKSLSSCIVSLKKSCFSLSNEYLNDPLIAPVISSNKKSYYDTDLFTLVTINLLNRNLIKLKIKTNQENDKNDNNVELYSLISNDSIYKIFENLFPKSDKKSTLFNLSNTQGSILFCANSKSSKTPSKYIKNLLHFYLSVLLSTANRNDNLRDIVYFSVFINLSGLNIKKITIKDDAIELIKSINLLLIKYEPLFGLALWYNLVDSDFLNSRFNCELINLIHSKLPTINHNKVTNEDMLNIYLSDSITDDLNSKNFERVDFPEEKINEFSNYLLIIELLLGFSEINSEMATIIREFIFKMHYNNQSMINIFRNALCNFNFIHLAKTNQAILILKIVRCAIPFLNLLNSPMNKQIEDKSQSILLYDFQNISTQIDNDEKIDLIINFIDTYTTALKSQYSNIYDKNSIIITNLTLISHINNIRNLIGLSNITIERYWILIKDSIGELQNSTKYNNDNLSDELFITVLEIFKKNVNILSDNENSKIVNNIKKHWIIINNLIESKLTLIYHLLVYFNSFQLENLDYIYYLEFIETTILDFLNKNFYSRKELSYSINYTILRKIVNLIISEIDGSNISKKRVSVLQFIYSRISVEYSPWNTFYKNLFNTIISSNTNICDSLLFVDFCKLILLLSYYNRVCNDSTLKILSPSINNNFYSNNSTPNLFNNLICREINNGNNEISIIEFLIDFCVNNIYHYISLYYIYPLICYLIISSNIDFTILLNKNSTIVSNIKKIFISYIVGPKSVNNSGSDLLVLRDIRKAQLPEFILNMFTDQNICKFDNIKTKILFNNPIMKCWDYYKNKEIDFCMPQSSQCLYSLYDNVKIFMDDDTRKLFNKLNQDNNYSDHNKKDTNIIDNIRLSFIPTNNQFFGEYNYNKRHYSLTFSYNIYKDLIYYNFKNIIRSNSENQKIIDLNEKFIYSSKKIIVDNICFLDENIINELFDIETDFGLYFYPSLFSLTTLLSSISQFIIDDNNTKAYQSIIIKLFGLDKDVTSLTKNNYFINESSLVLMLIHFKNKLADVIYNKKYSDYLKYYFVLAICLNNILSQFITGITSLFYKITCDNVLEHLSACLKFINIYKLSDLFKQINYSIFKNIKDNILLFRLSNLFLKSEYDLISSINLLYIEFSKLNSLWFDKTLLDNYKNAPVDLFRINKSLFDIYNSKSFNYLLDMGLNTNNKYSLFQEKTLEYSINELNNDESILMISNLIKNIPIDINNNQVNDNCFYFEFEKNKNKAIDPSNVNLFSLLINLEVQKDTNASNNNNNNNHEYHIICFISSYLNYYYSMLTKTILVPDLSAIKTVYPTLLKFNKENKIRLFNILKLTNSFLFNVVNVSLNYHCSIQIIKIIMFSIRVVKLWFSALFISILDSPIDKNLYTRSNSNILIEHLSNMLRNIDNINFSNSNINSKSFSSIFNFTRSEILNIIKTIEYFDDYIIKSMIPLLD